MKCIKCGHRFDEHYEDELSTHVALVCGHSTCTCELEGFDAIEFERRATSARSNPL